MKQIFLSFGLFLLIFSGLVWLFTRPPLLNAGMNQYRTVAEATMKTAFSKTNMYSEPVKMQDGRQGVFRLVMTNDAELQKQIKIAQTQGLKKLDVEGKEFFVDFQLFFLTFWIFLIALIIATPINWKSKLWSILWSTLAFFTYSIIRLYLLILNFLSNEVDIGIYQYGDFWSSVIKTIADTQKVGFSALVVFFIWIGFAASKIGWRKRFNSFQRQIKSLEK